MCPPDEDGLATAHDAQLGIGGGDGGGEVGRREATRAYRDDAIASASAAPSAREPPVTAIASASAAPGA